MTGITRVSKESIFSDLNNMEVVTTTSEKYEEAFGFTQKEVWDALKEYDLYEEQEQVRDWYDGFTFGRKRDIYNPWSIINYLEKQKFDTYWANTSTNGLNKRGYLEYELSLTNREVSIMFEKMIDGWFKQSGSAYNAFIKALLSGDIDAMNMYINRVASTVFSYFDTRKNPSAETEPERFYHGFAFEGKKVLIG